MALISEMMIATIIGYCCCCLAAVLVFGATHISSSIMQETYAAAEHCSDNSKCSDKHHHDTPFILPFP
jgi:hypothetical protein